MKSELISVLIMVSIDVAMLGYMIYRIFIVKSLIQTEEENRRKNVDVKIIERTNKYRKILNLVYGMVMSIFLVPIFIKLTIPLIFDIPNIMTENYFYVEGEIMNEIKGRPTILGKEVVIKNIEDGTTLKVFVRIEEYNKGDIVKVRYWPYIKVGEIFERQD